MLRNVCSFRQGEEVAILFLVWCFSFLTLKINMKMWCKEEVKDSMEGRLYRVLAAVASWRWQACMPCASGKCWTENRKQDIEVSYSLV